MAARSICSLVQLLNATVTVTVGSPADLLVAVASSVDVEVSARSL